MLNYEFPPIGAGAANANFYLLKEFSKVKNLYVDLVTCSPNHQFEEEEFSPKIRIYKLNVMKKELSRWKKRELIWWTIKAYFFVEKLIKQKRFDLCHCWFGHPCGLLGYMFKEKIPYIVSLRGSDVPFHNPELRILDKLLLRKLSRIAWSEARKIITNSEFLKEQSLKIYQTDISVICNGVDTATFVRKRKQQRENTQLLFVGRLAQKKGIDYLLEAIAKLCDRSVELVIAGDGPELNALKKKISRLKIDSQVRFLGHVTDKEKLVEVYQGADIFVLPSLGEGMSNALLEALSSGLPIISTDVGDAQTLVNKNGIIIETRSSNSIVKAINEIRKKDIEQMGIISRTIAENLTWKNHAQKYLQLYRDTILQKELCVKMAG
jgi:glycosyltransferase involved in cell wall biosynthesis